MHAVTPEAATQAPAKVLRAYGPGGIHHVLQECSDLYRERAGVSVAVYKASPQELAKRVPEDGDIFYAGAEYMVDDFVRRNPGVLDLGTMARLHPRRIGVVVRKGNPLDIRGVECLEREEIDLLAVRLEEMGSFLGPRETPRGNVRRSVYTGQEGVAAWRTFPELDAWVTYRSWHVELRHEAEFIEIPGDQALRYTPVALTNRTPHRREAELFIAFLKSPEARRIFVAHGWD